MYKTQKLQSTNLEDDTLILYDTPKVSSKIKTSRGVSKPYLSSVGFEKINRNQVNKKEVHKIAKAVATMATNIQSQDLTQKPATDIIETTNIVKPSTFIDSKKNFEGQIKKVPPKEGGY